MKIRKFRCAYAQQNFWIFWVRLENLMSHQQVAPLQFRAQPRDAKVFSTKGGFLIEIETQIN